MYHVPCPEEYHDFTVYVTLLLLLLSRFSRVRLCATPQMAAHQAPPSLGCSRQEHWSGLPFPSPMHESEKWKWSRSVVSDSSGPHGLQPTRLLCPWDFQEYWSGLPLPSPHIHTTIYKIDKQQGPTVLHRKLYSIYYNNLYRKRVWKRTNTCICIYI